MTHEVDELGAVARVQVESSVYSRVAIFKTAYWFTDRFYVFLSRENESELVTIELRAKQELSDGDLEVACREFCNSLIDQQVRQDVIQETGEIRDMLLRKAFGEGREHGDPDLLIGNNSNIPSSAMNYQDDPLRIGKLTGEN